MKEYHRVQADINLDAICNNIRRTREIITPKTKIMAVIKADGYGHGAIPIARVLDSLVDAYGVAIMEEGVELRNAGVKKPILLLGYTPASCFEEVVAYELIQTIFDYDTAELLSKEAVRQNKLAKVHIKLDTGMGRIGFSISEDSMACIKRIAKLEGIEIDGCFTHFARADEKDKEYTHIQLSRYTSFIDRLEQNGIHIPLKHVSNSAGIIDLPEANFDMVRSGISTYGLYPSEEVDKSKLVLEPAMAVRSCISFIKEVDKGCGISYGCTFVTADRTKIATIPVGYGDGYPRALSSQGRVLIHGQSAPILGRICMDQFMVDITHIEGVKVGDMVTLVGCDQGECITVEEVSAFAHSFNYEFVCDIGKRIPRVFYYNNHKVGTLDFYNCTDSTYDLTFLSKELD